jgi:ferredoxin-type protein NapH
VADLQGRRRAFQGLFFALFVAAPVFDLFRFDLVQGHFVVLGMPWTLGLDALAAGAISPLEAGFNIFVRGFLPVAAVVALALGVALKYGRLYCGWLCPHFSAVETLNGVMRRALGRPSVWEREALPLQDKGAAPRTTHRAWLLAFVPLALGFALLWAVVLLTYLLPPAEVYGNLWHGMPTRNQALFIGAASSVFFLEFCLARHLFCRFGCAVGLFQSLVWMANRKAMVVRFDRERANACLSCTNACDNACPMRLQPRTLKRHMFSCTQCTSCISACATAQGSERPLLAWSAGEDALDKSDRQRARGISPPQRVIRIVRT